jgi:hypothetical protein
MNNNNNQSESTTVYLGNTRTLSNEYLHEYCSKYGLVLDCSRRLKSSEQSYLVDFTFVRFLNSQSLSKFLSTSSHIVNNGINLDVRPFNEILHTAVPLYVDRKICLPNLPSNISLNDIKKYLRPFGTIKYINSEINQDEQKNVYIEFETSASRNKLLKGKIKHHRIRDHILNILPLLRPTDVDLHQMEEQEYEELYSVLMKFCFSCSIKNSMEDSNILIHLEREYNLKIREEFDRIENEITEFLKQKRQNYEQIRKMIE